MKSIINVVFLNRHTFYKHQNKYIYAKTHKTFGHMQIIV